MMNTSDEKKQGSRVGWKIKTPEEHVARIVAWFTDVVTVKYHRGQQEHGGDLWNKPRALANLEEELIDLPVYYKTAKDYGTNKSPVPCDMCDDFWCTRHQQHVYDCKCPPLEAWIEPPKKSQ